MLDNYEEEGWGLICFMLAYEKGEPTSWVQFIHLDNLAFNTLNYSAGLSYIILIYCLVSDCGLENKFIYRRGCVPNKGIYKYIH